MEHTSDLVYEGKLIHEDSYPQRTVKYEEIELDGIKVDFYDTKNKVIHEIKKSNKVDTAHEWQLECYKLAKHLLAIEEYKPLKMYW